MARRVRVPWQRRYRDSKAIAGHAFALLKDHRDLWIFPTLGGLLMLAVMAGSTVAQFQWPTSDTWSRTALVVAAASPVMVLMTMLNTAMARCLLIRMSGRPCRKMHGWRHAVRLIAPIALFTLVGGIVALLFTAVGEAIGKLRIVPGLGRLVEWVGVFAWAAATFFVIPLWAAGRTDTWGTVRASTQIAREHWGKSVAGIVTIGLVILVPYLVAVVLLMPVGMMIIMAGAGTGQMAFLFAGMGVMFLPMALMLIIGMPLSTALNTVYQTALYRFASSGEMAAPFDETTLVQPWEPYQ